MLQTTYYSNSFVFILFFVLSRYSFIRVVAVRPPAILWVLCSATLPPYLVKYGFGDIAVWIRSDLEVFIKSSLDLVWYAKPNQIGRIPNYEKPVSGPIIYKELEKVSEERGLRAKG